MENINLPVLYIIKEKTPNTNIQTKKKKKREYFMPRHICPGKAKRKK